MLDTITGEVVKTTLQHEGNNVREFYCNLPRPVRVGIEARILEPKARHFLIGAVIAKEKLGESPDGDAEGVAFMVKRGTAQFAKTGGWEFIYYPQSGDSGRTQEHCAECHAGAASTD